MVKHFFKPSHHHLLNLFLVTYFCYFVPFIPFAVKIYYVKAFFCVELSLVALVQMD